MQVVVLIWLINLLLQVDVVFTTKFPPAQCNFEPESPQNSKIMHYRYPIWILFTTPSIILCTDTVMICILLSHYIWCDMYYILQTMRYMLYFTDDVICVIFRCNTSCYTWESLMLAVLMTVAYVRHCSDGRMCAEYIRNLLEGLRCVIQRLDNSKQNLGGWVS